MLLGSVFDRFVTHSPLTVMARGLMEHALIPDELDALFTAMAESQYTRTLLFSTTVDLMSLVVCGVRPKVHAAYQALRERIPVSITSVYNKLAGMEPTIAAELVRHTACRLEPVIHELGGRLPDVLPGYRVKILDGNHLAATQHRLAELRGLAAGALPGQALVVLDPVLAQAIDVVPCEDGHAQERALLDQVVSTVAPQDLWIADRNFCTLGFLLGIARRQGSFVIREHKNLPWQAVTPLTHVGCEEGTEVGEQTVRLEKETGEVLLARRIQLVLAKPTRDGEREIYLLTNLPPEDADALGVGRLYRGRWTIEIAFNELEQTLESEIDTLAYPKAALFGFCVALAAYNVYATVKAALRAVHGVDTIKEELSAYYVADEIAGTYRGMMIAIPEEEWHVFRGMTVEKLAAVLRELAGQVRLERFKKHRRGPKKPRPKRKYNPRQPHVSTAKLLAERQKRQE